MWNNISLKHMQIPQYSLLLLYSQVLALPIYCHGSCPSPACLTYRLQIPLLASSSCFLELPLSFCQVLIYLQSCSYSPFASPSVDTSSQKASRSPNPSSLPPHSTTLVSLSAFSSAESSSQTSLPLLVGPNAGIAADAQRNNLSSPRLWVSTLQGI